MVSLHGSAIVRPAFRRRTMGIHEVPEKPPDPSTLLTNGQLEEKVGLLLDWWQGKKNILCLTGAGISTESGIPDYRGHGGSYHSGHKPMIHDQFITSEYQRKRYWGRGMVGWRDFSLTQPNTGHYALADLEKIGKVGVTFEDSPDYYAPERNGKNKDVYDVSQCGAKNNYISLITQNVDSLHRRAGSARITELHGRVDLLRCMKCGDSRSRKDFHLELESLNKKWLTEKLKLRQDADMRADGDAEIREKENFESLHIPSCLSCGDGFLKPDVVFFGDCVPKHRVARCRAAALAADGILVVGSSLAVHSAFRHVREASQKGIPIALLNVGETRAEREGLEVLKVEAPTGPTLRSVADHFLEQNESSDIENSV